VTYVVAVIVVIAVAIGGWLFIRYRRSERAGGAHAADRPDDPAADSQSGGFTTR
jgi:hypothetical protein